MPLFLEYLSLVEPDQAEAEDAAEDVAALDDPCGTIRPAFEAVEAEHRAEDGAGGFESGVGGAAGPEFEAAGAEGDGASVRVVAAVGVAIDHQAAPGGHVQGHVEGAHDRRTFPVDVHADARARFEHEERDRAAIFEVEQAL